SELPPLDRGGGRRGRRPRHGEAAARNRRRIPNRSLYGKSRRSDDQRRIVLRVEVQGSRRAGRIRSQYTTSLLPPPFDLTLRPVLAHPPGVRQGQQHQVLRFELPQAADARRSFAELLAPVEAAAVGDQ